MTDFAAADPDSSAPRSTVAGAPRQALLAGATGLVGRALLRRLLADPAYSTVHALARRPLPGPPEPSPKLHSQVVDFGQLGDLPPVDDVYIALGTTMKIAGSEAAFRRVDFDAVVATATAARRAGASRLLVVSALGADARSRVFYNRVKGEMEAAVNRLGYATVVVARPSLLLGDRTPLGQPGRTGEAWAQRLLRPVLRWLPSRIRPLEAESVAEAMVAAALYSRPGLTCLNSAAMAQRRR